MRNRKRDRKMALRNTEEWQKSNFRGKIATGIAILFFGVTLMVEKSGVETPNWLISGATILMSIGLVSLIKQKFQNTFGWIVFAIGSILLLNDIMPNVINTSFILPSVLILVGISIMFKTIFREKKKYIEPFDSFVNVDSTSDDYFESRTVFGGVEKIIMTKNFKGAKVSSVFGGHELNFMQADIESVAEIDISVAFGGVTLIVPSNWKIQSELNSTFGGVEDNRSPYNEAWQNSEKTLYLKGSCTFGGIEIKSFN